MQLSSIGWNDRFAALFVPHASAGFDPGRIIEQFNSIYVVGTERGEVRAQLSGRLRFSAAAGELPVTGDWVALRPARGDGTAQIHAVLPRATQFVRRAAGRVERQQVVAANLEYAFLLSGFDNDFSPRRIERYLAATWESGATPVVILNKVDLCDDPLERVRAVDAVAQGVAIHAVSALRGDGVDKLVRYCLPGQTVALLGSSGVGKSTLINRLMGKEQQSTQPLSKDGRGRHTTSRRQLVFCASGGMVIDTPGMRELQLWEDDEGLQLTFDEIETLARNCRFHNCRHLNEPGCAVRAAVDNGMLGADRLASLHKLQSELAMRNEASIQVAEKRRWKSIHKSVKRFMKESIKYR